MTRGVIRDWRDLLPESVRRVCSDALFRRAEEAYASPGRRYHTFQHIRACLELARQYDCAHPQRVMLALLLHDAVYVPGRRDNEELSARFAEELLQSEARIEADDIAAIARMIRLTAEHGGNGERLSADEKLMLDIDMSVLGGPWQEYLAYCGGVFSEFCPTVVGETKFRIGRTAFLKMLLKRDAIFLSPALRSVFEQRARDNIQRELDEILPASGSLSAVIAMGLGSLLGLTR